ncbi:DNA repair and recombination protein RadB [Candidatus Pacearchaeota archaeon]|nr:DNA repair and recombination protein RadB [Candidatus Pacearchaeota archaeon]|tara:strand:+ start:390 stop:1094 length:705 start_codon:yes stop_codon:yes gene_type:complete
MSRLSAGSYDLNKWLAGGYDLDVITTLYGGPGTGKTNFVLLAGVSQAKKGKKVLFIDTEGGFSSERVKQMVGKENGMNYNEVLKNIIILKPTNFDEQKKAFDKLLDHVKKQVSLIVVDGMTMLYRLEFADARDNGEELKGMQKVNSELTRQMRILAEISRKNNIPVLVTNQIYSWDNESKMVGGDILKYWSKCIIELVHDKGRRTVFMKKHRSMPEKSFAFQIHDGGIRKRGWI